jgi:hypothetical protein
LPVKVRLAGEEDAALLEPLLRDADRQELEAASGPDVLGQLQEAVRFSRGRLGRMAFVAELEGEAIALFGFVPAGALSEAAHPWLVGTDTLNRVPGMLTRLSRSYCSAVLGEYPVLVNYVDVRHEASVRWLSRLGFELQPPEPFGVAGLPFHRFEMRG